MISVPSDYVGATRREEESCAAELDKGAGCTFDAKISFVIFIDVLFLSDSF